MAAELEIFFELMRAAAFSNVGTRMVLRLSPYVSLCDTVWQGGPQLLGPQLRQRNIMKFGMANLWLFFSPSATLWVYSWVGLHSISGESGHFMIVLRPLYACRHSCSPLPLFQAVFARLLILATVLMATLNCAGSALRQKDISLGELKKEQLSSS